MKQRPILKAFVCTAQAFCIRSAMQGEEGKPEPAPAPEPYQLDPTPPAPDPEADRRSRKAALAEQAGRRLFGRSVDTTGDLFDPAKAPAPLFAAPTPRATVIA